MKITPALTLLLLMAILIACVSRPAIAPESAQLAAKLAKEPWEEKWEALVKDAKKEGRLVIYTTAAGDLRMVLGQAFRDRYNIDAESVMGRTDEIILKVQSERKAGIFLPDLYLGSNAGPIRFFKPAGILEPLPPALILPEVLDLGAWRGQRLNFEDREKQFNLAFSAYRSLTTVMNTELVKPDEISFYRDLLNPKWKGKIAIGDPTTPGSAVNFFAVLADSPLYGVAYLRELAKQEPVFTRNLRLLMEWVARGKYLIAAGTTTPILTEFQLAGSPITPIVFRGEKPQGTPGNGGIAMMNRAPHPNAAKVFLNWLLTREGQTIFSKVAGVASARLDVSVEHLDPIRLLDLSVTELNQGGEEFYVKQPEYFALFSDIFGHLIK